MSRSQDAGPPAWAWIGTGLLAVTLVLLAVFPDAVGRVRARFTQTTHAGVACRLEAAPCAVALPDGRSVTVDLGPRPLRAGLPLEWRVAVSDGTPVDRIEIAGISMNMGLTQVPVTPEGGGTWTARASLPVCTSAAMRWRADVLLGGTPPHVVSVPFGTQGRGG